MSFQEQTPAQTRRDAVASINILRQALLYKPSLHTASSAGAEENKASAMSGFCLQMPIQMDLCDGKYVCLLWLCRNHGSSTQELPDKRTAKCETFNLPWADLRWQRSYSWSTGGHGERSQAFWLQILMVLHARAAEKFTKFTESQRESKGLKTKQKQNKSWIITYTVM